MAVTSKKNSVRSDGYAQKEKESLVCVKCGKLGHTDNNCFWNKKCYKCGEIRHGERALGGVFS